MLLFILSILLATIASIYEDIVSYVLCMTDHVCLDRK